MPAPLLFLIAFSAPPQDHLLVGFAYDNARRPLAGVEVILNRRELKGTSDANGRFTLRLAPGDSTLGFRRIGYRPVLVSLLPPPTDTILVELRPSIAELDELIVTAPPSKPVRYAGTSKYDDVFQRQRVGLGTLIPREKIDQHFGVSTAELLQGIPGVRFMNGPPQQLRFARCQQVPGGVTVFVDGFRQVEALPAPRDRQGMNDFPEVELLNRINPRDIEMIEVFRGASQIPGVYHWNGCAVVAIWTRWNR